MIGVIILGVVALKKRSIEMPWKTKAVLDAKRRHKLVGYFLLITS
jgi:hypothetical protein